MPTGLSRLKLPCPSCGGKRNRVTDSEPVNELVYRTRKCLDCGQGFRTIERLVGVCRNRRSES